MIKGMLALLALSAALWGAPVAPPPCITASLHAYDAAGFSCSEGAEIFSNFAFSDTGTVSPLPGDSSVTVSPLAMGLGFDAGFAAPSGTQLDATISYTVAASAGFFTSDQLSMLGFAQSGSAAIDVAESVCVGAAFNASGACPTKVQTLNVFDNASGLQATASTVFATNPIVLGIVKDISVTGGAGLSAANLSLVDNVTPTSSPVPEPGTLLLVGSALLGLAHLNARRNKRRP